MKLAVVHTGWYKVKWQPIRSQHRMVVNGNQAFPGQAMAVGGGRMQGALRDQTGFLTLNFLFDMKQIKRS